MLAQHKLWGLLLLALVALWGPMQSLANSQREDIAWLLQFRDSVENWAEVQATRNLSGWQEDVPVCVWGGITCNESGRVVAVALDCTDTCPVRAIGVLSEDLSNMTALQTLDLGGNLFYGPLPLVWGQPGQFPVLENLYLSKNNLSGPIPWSGSQSFQQLRLLRLEGNHLNGSLPTTLALPNILVLRAFDNELSGTLGDELALNMPNLQILALSGNAFTGTLPISWGDPDKLLNLQELYLQFNQLVGGLPPSWGSPQSFPNLRFLNLAGNPLGGDLPQQWGSPGAFPRLASLTLNSSALGGPIPGTWASAFPTIEVINVEGNNLTGNLAVWSQFTSLQRLIIKPGNDGVCIADADQLPFRLCEANDTYCVRSITSLPGPDCPAPPAIEPSVGAAGAIPLPGGGATPSPSTPSEDTNDFPVVAVAVAVPLGVLALIFTLICFLWWRHRRGVAPRPHSGKAGRGGLGRRDTTALTTAHPFDTEEGQRKFTSPFGPSFDDVNEVAVVGASARRTSLSESQPYTSSDGSRSLNAMCARISTKSDDGRGDQEESAAAEGDVEVKRNAEGEIELGRMSTSTSTAIVAGTESTVVWSTGGVLTGAGGSTSNTTMNMPFSDWEIDPKDIEILKRPDGSLWELGSGGFGKVYKALRNGVQPVAVKILSAVDSLHGHPSGDRPKPDSNDFRREIAILKACRDANIVQFQGAYLGPDQTMLVTEFMEAGNLSANIQAGRVTWWRRGKKIALDIAKGLVFLHSRRIVHFDLKSPNILLARDGTAKIADVGMAKFMARDYVTGVVGTLSWAAPEMLWGQKCTEKADIYSFGIVLWEIVTGEKPVRGQLRDVRVPEECPEAVRQLILECLDSRPSKRPSALQLVERLRDIPGDRPPGSATPAQRLSSSSD